MLLSEITTPYSTKRAGPGLRELADLSRAIFLPALHASQKLGLCEWAAQTIVMPPGGPHEGEPLNWTAQPYLRLLFEAIESSRWSRVAIVGPAQSGKSTAVQIVILYHLIVLRERVIFALPDLRMAQSKWEDDFLPIIRAAGLERLLPVTGAGCRGGRVIDVVNFRGGGQLRFMTGGGSDAMRSNYTARVAVVTECDKLDVVGGTSREADKISQIEARTNAFDACRFIILESTASNSSGRIWREHHAGSEGRLCAACPYCQAWVVIERDHLRGWQEAESVVEAAQRGHWVCPACEHVLTETDRRTMNRELVLLHRGQSIDQCGRVSGEPASVDTLGFRWNAFNNLFTSGPSVAMSEWRARYDPDEANSEKSLRQFTWALPWDPPELDATHLDWSQVARLARSGRRRGSVPAGTAHLTAGLDIHKRLIYWVLLAHDADASEHVVDYGILEVPTDDLGEERALLVALRQWREMCAAGWPLAGNETDRAWPEYCYIDSGYQTDLIYAFVRESAALPSNTACYAVKGLGLSQVGRAYARPKSASGTIQYIGAGYHVSFLTDAGLYLIELDADFWKSYVHARAQTARDQPGALTLFEGEPREHGSFARQFTAESRTEAFEARSGRIVVRWINRQRRPNHYLDCMYLAAAAGHLAGVRVADEPLSLDGPSNAATAQTYSPGRAGLNGESFVARR